VLNEYDSEAVMLILPV